MKERAGWATTSAFRRLDRARLEFFDVNCGTRNCDGGTYRAKVDTYVTRTSGCDGLRRLRKKSRLLEPGQL